MRYLYHDINEMCIVGYDGKHSRFLQEHGSVHDTNNISVTRVKSHVLIVSPISERAVLDISGTMKKHNPIIRSAADSHTQHNGIQLFPDISNGKSNRI